jgi:inhibitor of KinA sporulation pathway (predicted exonuclease)
MTKFKLDRINVVDCEATCVDDNVWTRENGELIQISVVPIDLRTMTVRKDLAYTSYVKPLRTEISEYCTNLTGIKASDVADAPDPSHVFKEILEKYTANSVWGSWGKYDFHLIDKTCKTLGIANPFPDNYYNLKNTYSLLNGFRKEMGLDKALSEESLSFEGNKHDAYWDAVNTAKLMLKVLKRSIFEV